MELSLKVLDAGMFSTSGSYNKYQRPHISRSCQNSNCVELRYRTCACVATFIALFCRVYEELLLSVCASFLATIDETVNVLKFCVSRRRCLENVCSVFESYFVFVFVYWWNIRGTSESQNHRVGTAYGEQLDAVVCTNGLFYAQDAIFLLTISRVTCSFWHYLFLSLRQPMKWTATICGLVSKTLQKH